MRTSAVSALDLRPSRVARRLAPLLPAVALGLAGCALAAFERRAGAPTGAETEYLSVWAAFVLAGAALLAPPRHRGSLTAPVIAALAIWVLPGPARGVALGVCLVAAAAAAAWSRLRPAARERWDDAAWLGVALALHGLLRPVDLLPATLSPLEHGPGPLARLLLPPLAAALGLALLARRRGAAPALLAGIGAALAAAGMTATAAMPLLALALACEVAARGERAPRPVDDSSERRLVAGALRSPGGLGAVVAGVALLALVLMRPAAGGLALAAGAVLALPGLAGLAAAALPLVAGLGLALGRGGGVEAIAGLWQLPVLLPIALLPGKAAERSLLGALLLAAGGLLLLPAPPALAAAAALLALELRWSSAGAAAQRVWLAALLTLAALAAAYPWLRPEPLLAAAALLGVPRGWAGAAAVLAGALAAAGAAWLAERTAARRDLTAMAEGAPRRTPSDAGVGAVTSARRPSRAAAIVAAALVLLLLAAALPPLSRDLLRGVAIELGADGSWSHGWRGPARWLRIESMLTHAVAVPAGTHAGEVRLEWRGRVVDRLVLRVGHETAEWAADRPELRGRVVAAAPAVSWVAPDGRSFGHAYRAAWVRAEGAVDRVVVARSPGLPPETILVVRRLEVAR